MAHFSTINSVTSANSNLVRGDDEDSNNNNNIVNFPPLADMFTKALDNMKETEELRKRYRDTTRVKFQELSRKLKSAQAKTERPPDLSEEAHHRQLDKIETENYNLRKSINKMEGEIRYPFSFDRSCFIL
ncbi:hypothetical protein G9A89_005553 [Geosiphon pyriformis]|nr:hypothetical protein G9A89_005553 [Geosiphon pyriformis]